MTPEQEVDQEVLSIGFSHNFQVFLMEERLFEKQEREIEEEARISWACIRNAFCIMLPVWLAIYWWVNQ